MGTHVKKRHTTCDKTRIMKTGTPDYHKTNYPSSAKTI